VIVAFSASSRIASLAVISSDGELVAARHMEAPTGASGACLTMLEEVLSPSKLTGVKVFAADVGPGSFIGVRVGVTLAKTLAYACNAKATGASSFDLIAPDQTVVFPSKRGEFFVRRPGEAPFRVPEPPDEEFVGFGTGARDERYPLAEGFVRLLDRLQIVQPHELMPQYLIEPSISQPKKPYSGGIAGA
jgi:hypothetical protein